MPLEPFQTLQGTLALIPAAYDAVIEVKLAWVLHPLQKKFTQRRLITCAVQFPSNL